MNSGHQLNQSIQGVKQLFLKLMDFLQKIIKLLNILIKSKLITIMLMVTLTWSKIKIN